MRLNSFIWKINIQEAFEFGDEWEFNVDIVEIDDGGPTLLRPIIIESKGI